MKIKWRVQPAPTGRYRSFNQRGWPDAEYASGIAAVAIYSESDYVPRNVKTGEHKELTVRIADHSQECWKWRTLRQRFATLAEAKVCAEKFLNDHPEYWPKGE